MFLSKYGADVPRISQGLIRRPLASLCVSQPPGHKEDLQVDKSISLKVELEGVNMFRTSLGKRRSSIQYSWEKAEMIHKKFPINSISLSCTSIKSPLRMQLVEIRTKSERVTVTITWLWFAGSLHAAVLAFSLLVFSSDTAVPPGSSLASHELPAVVVSSVLP